MALEENGLNLGVEGSCNMYGVPLAFSVLCHFGVIRCTHLEMGCNSKMAGRRVKWSEIWESVVVICIWNTFDIIVVSIILLSSWSVT